MAKTHPPYPEEFGQRMVELVQAGRAPVQLSREFECSAQAAQAAKDAAQTVTTPTGATLTIPQGFTVEQKSNLIRLDDPDQESVVYLVEVKATDLDQAIAAAWAAGDPSFSRPVEQTLNPPARKGFDENRVVVYVAGENDEITKAWARRKGELTWVALIRGTPPSLDKRRAQIDTFLTSMQAPGVEEIDLADKQWRSISESADQLRAFIDGAMKAAGTPGLSIAVVENGQVVWAEGFGVRELGKPDKVTAETLMMIGSVSKSLTTLMMASLVDEGKLSWTAKVTSVLPEFRLADQDLSQNLTVEQLVCACAGLPRKDLPLILGFGTKEPKDVFKELAGMSPSTGLKETFQYQNHMAAAGGYVAAHAFDPDAGLGAAFDRAMAQRVFQPLGMSRTTLSHEQALKDQDRATPHAQDLKAVHHVVNLDHERFVTYLRPSGGIWSSAKEMALYVALELARGRTPEGEQLVTAENLTYRWQPQVAIDSKTSYGLGWASHETKGIKMIIHGGGTMGFVTRAAFFPDKQIGAVMISNGTGGHLVGEMVLARLLELWFNIDDRAQEQLDFALKAQKEEFDKMAKRSSTPKLDWMAPFLGAHNNPELGDMIIEKAGNAYTLDAGEYQTELVQYQRPDGKTVLLCNDPPLAGLELVPLGDKKGAFEIAHAQEKYVFQSGRG